MSFEPPRIFVFSKLGVWHVAVATYPNAADTECGLKSEPCSLFVTERDPDRIYMHGGRHCLDCFPPKSD